RGRAHRPAARAGRGPGALRRHAARVFRPRRSRGERRGPMPRVKEIEDDRGDATLKDVFAKERETFGDLLNTTKVYAHCPPILEAAKQLSASIAKSGQLPAPLLPLIYLRVALINGCPF